jgi:hypothetical protein
MLLDWAKAIHQAIGIESPRLFIAMFACAGFILFGGAAWVVDHGYRIKLKQEQSAAPETTTPPVGNAPGTKPTVPEKNKRQIAIAAHPAKGKQAPRKPQIGNDNTLVNVPIPPSMGDGNTFVGPTDANGNTIYNKGGTAIGKGACADPTSIAIGAGAGAGACATSAKPPDHPNDPHLAAPQNEKKPN